MALLLFWVRRKHNAHNEQYALSKVDTIVSSLQKTSPRASRLRRIHAAVTNNRLNCGILRDKLLDVTDHQEGNDNLWIKEKHSA